MDEGANSAMAYDGPRAASGRGSITVRVNLQAHGVTMGFFSLLAMWGGITTIRRLWR